MVTSFATLPLTDASRDSRIHDWIAEQYSFALSEFQPDLTLPDDPPSLRESKLLPDDFDIITRPPPSSHQPDTDCDDNTNLEDAFNGLIREMTSWRFASPRSSVPTANRNKALPATPSPPPTPTLENFSSPPPTAPSSPSSSTFPVTPTSSFRPLHRRSKPLDGCPPPAESDSEPTSPLPRLMLESSFAPSARHAIYVSAPKTSPPSSPDTPTPIERTQPPEDAPLMPPSDPALFAASTDRLLKVYPSGLAAGEASRWSVASTSLPSRRSPTPTPNSMPILPTFIHPSPKPKRELPSIRTRLLSTFGLRPRNSAPPSPTGSTFPSTSRRNSYRTSWTSEKKLIVSGLEEGNLDAELAVKRWCESFGELRRISRKDGALHVSWKKASVADTVCRLEARVFIKGVGSVGLSWITEPRLF
ncbi:hypothetical protein BGW80DRAFT_1559780 [Lactifluus volemus]|nr:hypothetical protein BGW80DRAFT_1559780 [Lactifluus volemus]